MATASLVLGIISLSLSWIPVVNIIAFILCILSFIFAIISLSKNNNNSKGISVAGLITSIISFSIIILFTFMFSMLISNIISEVKVNLEEFKNELYYEDELYSTYSINEDIKLNDRVIKVDKVEKDKVNEIYTPKEGNELIFITISTKNISIYDILYNCDDFKLIDKNFNEYECDYNKIKSNTTFTKGSIEPEKVKTGVLCFEVPENVGEVVLQYNDYAHCINISLD